MLSDGRKELIATATRRAQAGLDAAHAGIELSSLELTRLTPPKSLAADFDTVQSAFIGAQTKVNEAQTYRESAIPRAQAESDSSVESAKGSAESDLAMAEGEGKAFLALTREYRANPTVVRERLYRDATDKSLAQAGEVRWVPPPSGGNYHGFRITLRSTSTLNQTPAPEDTAPAESRDVGDPPPGGDDR